MARHEQAWIYLDVKFHDKDRVKRLGARWDAAAKRWFVPFGTDCTPLMPWMGKDEKAKQKQLERKRRAVYAKIDNDMSAHLRSIVREETA